MKPRRISLENTGLALLLAVCASFSGCAFRVEKGLSESSSVAPTYEAIRARILVPKCVQCHQGDHAKHHIDLGEYRQLWRGLMPILIEPGNPEGSSLYTSVKSGKMPKNSAPLSRNEIEAIRLWILNGAKEREDVAAPKPAPSPSGEPCDTTTRPGEPGAGEPGAGEPGGGVPGHGEPGGC